MKVYNKGRFLSTEHIWFEDFDNYENVRGVYSKADNIVIHGNSSEIQGKYVNCIEQESLVSLLEEDSEKLMKQFSSTTRNEIRRAERENVQIRFYTYEDINKDGSILTRMATQYTNMYAEKGMNGVELPVKELHAYAKNAALMISVANIDNAEVVFHSYIVDVNKSRLLHSCSEFRVADNAMRNAIGRANKYLHYKDMIYLHNIGIKFYDWGGISSSSEPNGIDKFKMSFGGEIVKYYNLQYINSFKRRILGGIIDSVSRRG